jgi:hypothetical protein
LKSTTLRTVSMILRFGRITLRILCGLCV